MELEHSGNRSKGGSQQQSRNQEQRWVQEAGTSRIQCSHNRKPSCYLAKLPVPLPGLNSVIGPIGGARRSSSQRSRGWCLGWSYSPSSFPAYLGLVAIRWSPGCGSCQEMPGFKTWNITVANSPSTHRKSLLLVSV